MYKSSFGDLPKSQTKNFIQDLYLSHTDNLINSRTMTKILTITLQIITFFFSFFFNSKQLTRRKKAMRPSRKKNTKQPYQDIHWPCILGILISKTCVITLKFAFWSLNENCFSYHAFVFSPYNHVLYSNRAQSYLKAQEPW